MKYRLKPILSRTGSAIGKPVLPKKTAKPKKPRKQRYPEFITDEDADRLIACIFGERDRLAAVFVANTGLRVGELTGLVWGDVTDREGNPVEVLIVRGEIAKRGKKRKVPLNQKAKDCIVGMKSLLEKRAWPTNDQARFLQGWKGRGLTARSFQLILKEAATQAKIRVKVSPHTLRHLFATRLLQKGVSLEHIRELLGHDSIATTQIYVHVRTEDLARAVDRL